MNGTKQNPYVGTRPFKMDEGDLFFGREREFLDLLSLVISERLVLFYAQSGAGKSSLINAKLIPGLLAEGEHQVLPVGRVGGGEPFSGEVVDNIYVYNLNNGLLQQNVRQDILSKLTLTKFLNGLGTGKEASLKRILIIDQFEELFSTYQEAWKKREDFFRQLAQAMHDIPQLWVVLVMREDYIAHLDPYIYLLPGKLRVRYYMQRLQRDAALEAIKRPVEDLRPYAEGVAEKLVDDLCSVKIYKPDGSLEMRPGQYVEPVQLQVVCSNLWKNLPWNRTQITEKDLQEVGDANTSLGNHYAGRVKEVAAAKKVKERKIREWFSNKLISPTGVRNMVLREPAGKSSGLENDVIQALHDLVRAEQRGGAIFYELTHDRLVEPIIENNKRWGTEHDSPLQRQVALWKDHGQNESWLLKGKAWAEVEDWAKDHQEELTDTEWEFLEASRSLVERERRAKWLTRLITAMGIVAIILAVFAYRANLRAQRQARIATARQIAAQSQSIIATGNSKQMTAVLLAIHSMSMFSSIEAVQVLQNNLLARPISTMTHDNNVRAVAFSPDGKYIVSGSADRSARVWDAATGQEVARMSYDGAVSSVAFSPDGQYVVAGSLDNTARVWETLTGKEIARIIHRARVNSVTFSPDGQYVVSGGLDKTVRVWEALTGKEIIRMNHSDEVSSVSISPDGRYVVSGSLDGTARIWETVSGKEMAPLSPEDGSVYTVAFSPDGRYVATGSEIYAYIWDAATGRQKFRIWYGERVTSIAFSPDSKDVVSGSWNHIVQVWNVATGTRIASMSHDSNVRVVAFSPDGKFVASGGRDNTARVWDAATGREVARMTYDGIVTSLAFSPDSQYVVSGSMDNLIRLWEATASKEVTRIPHDGRVWSVAFSPDGEYIVSGSEDFMVHLRNRATGQEIARMSHDNEVFSVAFSPDGKYVLSGSEDHTARVWEIATGQEIARMSHDNEVFSVAFSPDGKYVLSGSLDKTARLWEATTGKEVARLQHEDSVEGIAFSPDGKYVVSSSRDSTVRVWDIATEALIASMAHEPDSNVRAVAFSPDGKYVASGSSDYTIRVWETTTGREVTRMIHDSNVRAVVFSPDGNYILSGSSDNTVRVWKTTTGREVTRMIHDDRLNSVAFSPDGIYVVSGSEDTLARVWLWRPVDLIEKACARVTRTLTIDEWNQYLQGEPYQLVCQNLQMESEPILTPTP